MTDITGLHPGYEIFLMRCIAFNMGYIPDIEYDLQWDLATTLYMRFCLSTSNNPDANLYESIEQFLGNAMACRTNSRY